ncbi:MAG: ATP-binding protein [Epsilonproteobacteria bacterium]|nr:MAG: ATP-binding protein [Campylobacterota bacterium]
MENLLGEFYRLDLHAGHFIVRKTQILEQSCQLNGITQSGKTALIKHTLLGRKKSSYLYIDCNDIRIDTIELNIILGSFCKKNKVECVALDNYHTSIVPPNVPQLIISSEVHHDFDNLETIRLYPLDYEEFLAYEHKYDSTALNHFFQLGGFPGMHRIVSDDRNRSIQKNLQFSLSDIEFNLMLLSAKMSTQKISAFSLYERLKSERRISKDMLYKNMQQLTAKGYLHQLAKFEHPRATKKLYLCDIAIKNALSTQKHFGRLFENLIYLEMHKRGFEIYYDEGIDFYLPEQQRVVLCMPFGNQEMLFKKVEHIEAFIITHNVTKVEVVTMSSESELSHPFATVEMIPFAIWALVEGE